MSRFLVALTALASLASTQEPARRPTRIDAGPLQFEVHLARTAQLFHVVDQISGWSPYCHSQYRKPFLNEQGELDAADLAQLKVHQAIRAVHGWGGGLEQSFYTPLDLDTAVRDAVARGTLSEQRATDERRVLMHFAERIDRLYGQEQARLLAFRDRLAAARAELQAFATKVSRFCKGTKVNVPVFLIANPADRDFGGGYNGERLTIEVPRTYDAMPTFLHETMHAFVNVHADTLKTALRKEPSLDYETLNEGIAYALAPGIYCPESEGDALRTAVAQDLKRGMRMDQGLVRFRRFGLALRPLLREALDSTDQTIDTFLPRALDAWRVMMELEAARVAKTKGWFSAGPAWQALQDLVAPRGLPISSMNHMPDHYRQILERAAPGSRLVLLFALDHGDRKPVAGYEDLCPKPLSEIEAELARGNTVEMSGRARELEIVVLAAPTVVQLEKLIRETHLLR